MTFSLGAVLTPVEADTLAQHWAFTRTPSYSGAGWLVRFNTAADRQGAALRLDELRSAPLPAAPGDA